ncbi:MAG: glycosyltransferase family 2 protein, partial [Anaerolineae bacterium]|nr:glycosyltransferase family 2 protein [Anaerolineae bacterium]
ESGVMSLWALLKRLGILFEILIVNDASKDRTGEIADELARRFPEVRVVHHPTNRGIGGGFLTGVAEAQGEWLILIPADLAMDPAELSKYLRAAEGTDVVVGIRSDRSDYSGWRRLVSWLNIRLIQLLFSMPQRQFNYISMYRLSVLRQMRIEYWRSAFFHAETLIKARDLGYRLAEVEIQYVPRASGRATGAKTGLIVRTVRDMVLFWLRRTFLRRSVNE